jgi:putative transposase
MKYEFIEKERSVFVLERMCRVLAVSRSGYYRWKRQILSKRQQDNEYMLMQINESHRQSHGTYGSPRIYRDIRAEGIVCGKNRIARLMRIHGIQGKAKKKYKATTNSRHNLPIAPNLVCRNFESDRPNKVWVSDITYIWTQEGWVYLAVILDIFSRMIVGWNISARLTDSLVVESLHQAQRKRNSGSGLVFHSDRGAQYASKSFRSMLMTYGFKQSMSRKGDCWDNAVAESFFHTLKTELVYGKVFMTREEARQELFEYIEMFYNQVRRHSALGYCAPGVYEQKALAA